MNKRSLFISKISLILFLFMPLTHHLWAASAAFSNDAQDARALGNANAMVARADSPATNWFNPAGLVDLENKQFAATVLIEATYNELDSKTSGNIDAKNGFFIVPALFFTQPLTNDFSWGIGLGAPYGLSTEWDDPVTKYVSTFAEFTPIIINPNLAYQINEKNSVAFGLDISVAEGTLKKRVNQSLLNSAIASQASGTSLWMTSPDAKTELTGEDEALGWNIAWLHKINNHTQIGWSYRSAIDFNLDGELEMTNLSGPSATIFGSRYKTDTSLEISTPATFTVGLAYDYNDHTTLEIDLEWAQWSVIDVFDVNYKNENNPVRLSLLNIGNPIPKKWEDTWNIAVAAEHIINSQWTIFGGTRFRPSPIPEETYDTILAGNDLFDLDGGFSYFSNSSRIDLGIACVWSIERDIQNNVGQIVGADIDGDYTGFFLAAAITYTKNF